MINQTSIRRLPHWMKSELPNGKKYTQLKNLIAAQELNTICTSGNCPNRGECWNNGTASFMILGDKCTRNCRFCAVKNLIPDPIDWNEAKNLADTIKKLQLKHCVITSVARDDLADGGAEFWATCIREIKRVNPSVSIETLIPDFDGKQTDLIKIIDAKPDVISHNIETVERLTAKVRSRARYKTSLQVLKIIADSGIVAKTGIMLGLGEREEEVLHTMDELRNINCKVLTIGQYLQPEGHHLKVVEYIKPEVFAFFKSEGLKRGFSFVESSPLVRSSYHAEKHVNA